MKVFHSVRLALDRAMTPEDRRQLLRQRFKAIGGIPYPKSNRPPRPPPYITKRSIGKPLLIYYGEYLYNSQRPDWVSQPNMFPSDQLRLKRRKTGINPYILIAAKAPKKLKRLAAISPSPALRLQPAQRPRRSGQAVLKHHDGLDLPRLTGHRNSRISGG
jgi:hypothetical protein